MLNELDTKNTETIKSQITDLKAIVSELIDIKTGKPKPGATKAQMQFAIDQIRNIQSTYDERAKAHEALARETNEAQGQVVEVRALATKINKKYGGNVYPKWFMKMLGCK